MTDPDIAQLPEDATLDDRLARLAIVTERFSGVREDAFIAAYATPGGGVSGVTYGDIAVLTERLTYVLRVLRAFAISPNDCTEMLLWRTDSRWAPLTFMVNCSDFFHYATADAEEIEPADLDALEQAFADVAAAGVDLADRFWGAWLFAARKQGMRPIRAAYRDMPAALVSLFDACGPERGVQL